MTLVNVHAQSPEPWAMNPSTDMLSRVIEHWDAKHALTEAMGAELADYHLQCICLQRPRDIAPERACKAVGLPEGYYWSEVVSDILGKDPGYASGREYICELKFSEYVDELCAVLRQFKGVTGLAGPVRRVPSFAPDQAISCWLAYIDDALSMLDGSTQECQELLGQLLLLKEELSRSKS